MSSSLPASSLTNKPASPTSDVQQQQTTPTIGDNLAPISESERSASSYSLSQESQKSEPRKSPLNLLQASSVHHNGQLGSFNKFDGSSGGFGSGLDRDYPESEKSAHSYRSGTGHGGGGKSSNGHNRSSEWEIVEGLKEGQRCEEIPLKCEGFLLKRRKWPLKGWHKRYFCLDKGILTYAKTPAEMAKGKTHGSVDVGLSVISTKSSSGRIDIDAEEYIYHIKIKNKALFSQWVGQLKHHRLYRQHEIAFGSKVKPGGLLDYGSPIVAIGGGGGGVGVGQGGVTACCTTSPVTEAHSKVANWILDSSNNVNQVEKELAELQVKLVQLSSFLQTIELQLGARSEHMPDVETGSIKKYRRRFLLRRHKKHSTSVAAVPSGSQQQSYSNGSKVNKLSASAAAANNNGANSNYIRKPNTLEILVSDVDTASDLGTMTTSNTTDGMLTLLPRHLSASHASLNDTELHHQQQSSQDQQLPSQSQLQQQQQQQPWGMSRSYTEVGKPDLSGGGHHSGNIAIAHNYLPASSQHSSKNAEEFLSLASDIHHGLRSCLKTILSEKDSLKTKQLPSDVDSSAAKLIASLQLSLQQTLDQNVDLKQRLKRIHDESEVASLAGAGGGFMVNTTNANTSNNNNGTSTSSVTEEEEEVDEPTLVHQPIGNSKSYESSSVLSISEYFDAAEKLSVCSTSSEDEDDGSFATDASEDDVADSNSNFKYSIDRNATGRRSKLPVPKPDFGELSLWSLLCKNIGKDLSKISMPVTLNEPLNSLQRLCEELEYNEVLDKAAQAEDACERMLYVAAFAVSAYSSSCYRAGHKPFNPLLGETYECIREDKGFRFVSEQVSHHPPVSACHAESDNYLFWQDIRIKSKFWGKSMEVIPFGTVHVLLKKTNSHYRWNKVTTCVHNIFKGQRWVDQYGEMIITDGDLRCKLTFVKASYWSNKRHEVCGTITSRSGEVLERIFGKWNEALYCGTAPNTRCIWRPAAIPDEHELYYGFTRFAIELNELLPELVSILPPTDTRFRPDQRLLEEGKVQEAESIKMKLEQLQRERRKKREELGMEFRPLWFKKEMRDGEEVWVFNENYWSARESQFEGKEFEDLWPSDLLLDIEQPSLLQ